MATYSNDSGSGDADATTPPHGHTLDANSGIHSGGGGHITSPQEASYGGDLYRDSLAASEPTTPKQSDDKAKYQNQIGDPGGIQEMEPVGARTYPLPSAGGASNDSLLRHDFQ